MCSSSRHRRSNGIETVGSRHEGGPARRGPEMPPEMRASDEDRERVVEMLRDHGAAGRLSTEELEQRTGAALSATTHGQLDALLTDLPHVRDARRSEHRRERARREFAEHVRTYVMVMGLLIAIWALTGMGYFWPVWPALGWGIGVLCHGAATPRRRSARAPSAIARA
jgi:hypothetical protein